MRVKVATLTEPSLDWAVAVCIADTADAVSILAPTVAPASGLSTIKPEGLACARVCLEQNGIRQLFTPTTDWDACGPLLERAMQEGMSVNYYPDERQFQAIQRPIGHWSSVVCFAYGPTLLLAVLRCYVLSKMGPEIDVPDVLVPARE